MPLFGYLEDAGVLVRNPVRKLVAPTRERRQPRVPTEGKYKWLLEVVRGDIRDAAIGEVTKDPGNVGSVHL